MSTFAIVQAVVLTVVLLASLLAAFRKLLPKTAKRVQARLSAWLDRSGRAPPSRRLGRWLQPSEAKNGGCGSGVFELDSRAISESQSSGRIG